MVYKSRPKLLSLGTETQPLTAETGQRELLYVTQRVKDERTISDIMAEPVNGQAVLTHGI